MATPTAAPVASAGPAAPEKKSADAVQSAVATSAGAPAHWTDALILNALKTPARTIGLRGKGCCAEAVVVARLNDSLPQVFQRLVDHNISGMPVVVTGSVKECGAAYAYIGLEDLVARIVALFSDAASAEKPSLEQLFAKTDAFAAMTVREALRTEALNPIGFVPSDASLWLAVEEVVRHQRYRVAAANPATECITHIVTPSMCIAWLAAGIDLLMPEAQRVLIRDIKPKAEQSVAVMQHTESALSGFTRMRSGQFSGLPVVDKTGALVDMLTVRDLKCITPTAELLHRLLEPVDTFKAAVRKAYPHRSPQNPAGLYLLPTDSLKRAVTMMATHRVHHLPIVTDTATRRVVGQMSQSDILRFLVFSACQSDDSL